MTEHFFVVGAQRCGTTFLYRRLEEHPAIAMARPVRPEPKFFLVGESRERTLADYEGSYFSHATPGQLRGEKSAGYLESPLAAAAIRRWFPDARIIVLVREPVARAISNYRFSVENGIEHLAVDEALLTDPHQRVERRGSWFEVGGVKIASNPFLYLERGRYAEAIEHYTRCFGARNVHVVVLESLVRSPGRLQEVYRFLGLDEFVASDVARPVNTSEIVVPTLLPDTRRLLADYYQAPNQRLAEDFDLDLTSWSAPGG